MIRNRKNPAARKQEGFLLNVMMLVINNYLLYRLRFTPAILK